jgi:molybdate transport system regulatory protein
MVEVTCQLSISRNGQAFLSPQKTELLRQIKACGSLNAAAKAIGISYQHAWNLINEMNRTSPNPLVEKQRGGANGGGATVSAYGEQILNEYRLIEAEIAKLIKRINVEINL